MPATIRDLSQAAPGGPRPGSVARDAFYTTVAAISLACLVMRIARSSLVAAAVVAAVLAYGGLGHGHPEIGHDDMAAAATSVCLLLATALGVVATPRAGGTAVSRPADLPARDAVAQVVPPDGRARASPSTLQRFLN
jgi:hypothetical protein